MLKTLGQGWALNTEPGAVEGGTVSLLGHRGATGVVEKVAERYRLHALKNVDTTPATYPVIDWSSPGMLNKSVDRKLERMVHEQQS